MYEEAVQKPGSCRGMGQWHQCAFAWRPKAGQRALVCSSDSNFANCRRSRKSTSCGVIRAGNCLVCIYSRTQAVIGTSSGEVEWYSQVSVAAECIHIRNIFEFFGFPMQIYLETDASAAIGIGARLGTGKVKHLEVKTLWLQQKARSKEIKIEAVALGASPAP